MLLVLLIISIPLCVPIWMKKRMEKRAAVLERDFPNINYKFTSHNWCSMDTEGGHIGVVWKNNPAQLQMVDPAQITDIRTNDGQQLRGTALVSCQFRLDGKKVKIYTLRLSGGQLAMKHPRGDGGHRQGGPAGRDPTGRAGPEGAERSVRGCCTTFWSFCLGLF